MNYKEKFKNLPRTPWFNAEVNPAYPGVYERYFNYIDQIVFQYWDGTHWWTGQSGSKFTVKSFNQDSKLWRGCSKRSDALV